MGRLAEARAHREHALALNEQLLGPEHPALVPALRRLGSTRLGQGDLTAAEQLLQRARTLEEQNGPATASHKTLLHLALLRRAQGRRVEALALLERALERCEFPLACAEVELQLARMLWTSGEARARAVQLASRARDAYKDAGHQPGRAEALQWLQAHHLP